MGHPHTHPTQFHLFYPHMHHIFPTQTCNALPSSCKLVQSYAMLSFLSSFWCVRSSVTSVAAASACYHLPTQLTSGSTQGFDAFAPPSPPLAVLISIEVRAHSSHDMNYYHSALRPFWYTYIVPQSIAPHQPPILISGRLSALRPVLSQPRSISLNAMSTNPSPDLKSLFQAALNEFESRSGTNLIQHQIIRKLVNCQSAESVIHVLQEQAQAFRNFRGDDGKIMTWLKRTVNVLYTLSTSSVLSAGIGLVSIYSCH